MYKVRIPTTNQVYNIETTEKLSPGETVLVEAEQIVEPAVILCDKIAGKNSEFPPANFLRKMTPEDLAKKNELKGRAKQYLEEAVAKTVRHNLDMKILDADLSFDEKKLTFYFGAESRIDFRSLVADMVGSFRKIIRLQQIGPREEAKFYGGFGRCGQELCCHRFLKDMDKVTADTAGLQELAGGKLSKMTGCCGRLMCCLSYETEDIKDIKKQVEKK